MEKGLPVDDWFYVRVTNIPNEPEGKVLFEKFMVSGAVIGPDLVTPEEAVTKVAKTTGAPRPYPQE